MSIDDSVLQNATTTTNQKTMNNDETHDSRRASGGMYLRTSAENGNVIESSIATTNSHILNNNENNSKYLDVYETNEEQTETSDDIDIETGNANEADDDKNNKDNNSNNHLPTSPPLLRFLTSNSALSGMWKFLFVAAVVGYTVWACIIDMKQAKPLLILEAIIIIYQLGGYISSKYFSEQMGQLEDKIINFFASMDSLKGGRITALVTLIICALIIGLSVEDSRNLISALGLLVFVAISFAFSWIPNKVNWRPVMGGVLIQLLFGLLILRTSGGYQIFAFFGDQIDILLSYTQAGSTFMYGYLADTDLLKTPFQMADGSEYVLVPPIYFSSLCSVFLFTPLISVLHYLGILDIFVSKIGYVVALVLGTSAAETLNAIANIFIGGTTAPLIIRSFLPTMTESELHCVMAAGMASIAGAVLPTFVGFGISAHHLLAASVMSAPAALAISKVMYPETETPESSVKGGIRLEKPTDSNVIEAATNGASQAIKMVLSIRGMAISFLALIAMIDGLLGGIGNLINQDLSFASICRVIFYPVAWLLGVSAKDCGPVAALIGTKLFAGELIAFAELGQLIADGSLDAKSATIATYAMCGFSNFGMVGITLGGLTPLAPEKKGSLTKLVVSSMVAGNLACYMTAAVAGLLYDPEREL